LMWRDATVMIKGRKKSETKLLHFLIHILHVACIANNKICLLRFIRQWNHWRLLGTNSIP